MKKKSLLLPFECQPVHKISKKFDERTLGNFCFCIFGPKNVSFFKNPKSHFYQFSYFYHQVEFQKNLMNKFRENFKLFILGSKMTHFEHNLSFPSKSKTANFIHSLIPVSRHDFRNKKYNSSGPQTFPNGKDISLTKNYCTTIRIQKISSIHKFILTIQQIFGSH